MNENSTNNNKQQAKQYPDETGYSIPGTYTDPEWEAYLEWNTPKFAAEGSSRPEWMNKDITEPTTCTPEYYRKEGKPEWNLVDFPSLEPLVRALEYGKSKHGKFSYRNFIPKDILLDKLYRHLIEIHKGNFIDEETGEHHIGGVLANAMFYSYHHRYSDLIPRPSSYSPKIEEQPPCSKSHTLSKSARLAAEDACIFKLKQEGKKIREIANLLELSERTVYRRLHGI